MKTVTSGGMAERTVLRRPVGAQRKGALHEFDKFDRMLGEMTGIVFAVVLGLVALLLKGLARRIEDHDDGEPVSLALGLGTRGRGPTSKITGG